MASMSMAEHEAHMRASAAFAPPPPPAVKVSGGAGAGEDVPALFAPADKMYTYVSSMCFSLPWATWEGRHGRSGSGIDPSTRQV